MAGYFNPNFRKNVGVQQNNQNQQWSLTAKFGKFDNGKLVIKLGGFKWEDINLMNQIDPSVFNIKKIQNAKGTTFIVLIIPSDKLGEFVNLIPQIEQQLKNTNNYTAQSISQFSSMVEDIIDDTPTEDDLKDSESNIINNWKELLKHLKDPEYRKKFLLLQTTENNFEGKLAETLQYAKLSPKNVVEILSQDPLATFVTSRHTWEDPKKFNRTVNPGAPSIIFTKSEKTLAKSFWQDPQVLSAKQRLLKNGKPVSLNTIKDELGNGVYVGLVKKHNMQSNSSPEFYKVKGFDVRFTTPRDPNNDPFMKLANLVNNLTGEMNQAAIDAISNEYLASGKTLPSDINKKVEGIENQGDLLKFKDFILKKCKRAKINVAEIGSTDDIISNAIYSYGMKIAEDMNILKDDAKTAFAATLVTAVCERFNIQNQRVQQCFNIMSHFNDKQLEDVILQIYQIYASLANFKVEEAVGSGNIMSFDEFKNFVHSHMMNKDTIKKDFDDFNNRMDNLYK